jgi:hypothetical protein
MGDNRGRSPLRPTKSERDAIVQVWLNRCDLATIGLYMESKGMRIIYMADILRFCVETTRSLVLKSGCKYVDSTAMANEYLVDRTGINLNRGNRGMKNLVTNLLSDTGYTEGEIPDPPRPEFSESTIDEIKKNAREQFAQNAKANPEELLVTREEKDEKVLQEQNQAFLDIIKNRTKLT